jgi:hypothetical protein
MTTHMTNDVNLDDIREPETLYGRTIQVPIDRIRPDRDNLRNVFDEEDLRDLGRNLLELGQLDEITIFPDLEPAGQWNGFFDLHDGERRWRAARQAGLSVLRAKVEARPADEELIFKKMSRVLQTRALTPEAKVAAVERGLEQLGVVDRPDAWESYRSRLGGGQEWPQIMRVLKLQPRVRQMMDDGSIGFTLAQSIGRLPAARQQEVATFVVVNKINARYASTQLVPYLLENSDATVAQAFEHTKVGDWRQFMRSPFERGQEPPTHEKLEQFLEACVRWERAWEVLVHTRLVHEVRGHPIQENRLKEAAHRIEERAHALLNRIERQGVGETHRELPEGSSPALASGGNL